MFIRQQVLLGQSGVNRIERVPIGLRRQGGRHLSNEVDLVGFTGLRQVGLVPDPLHFAFRAVARLFIMRRV